MVRPLNGEAGKPHPLSLIARYDRVTTNTDKDSRYNVFIGGAAWDLSTKASLSLDYQANEPVSGSPIARSHTWFAHFVARF